MAAEDNELWFEELLAQVRGGNLERVTELLHEGHDVNRVSEEDRLFPLGVACQYGRLEVAKLLLDHGADINLSGPEGQTALHLLCGAEERCSDMAELGDLLILRGASIDAADNMGKTPVLRACESEDHKLVRLLCREGCNVNIHDYNGDSPIKVACKTAELWFFWHCRPETAAAAAACGSSNSKGEGGGGGGGGGKMEPSNFPPIIIAKQLLEAGADPREATLLPAAVNFGAVEVVKEFLQLGMDVNMLDDNQRTPLGCACTAAGVPPSVVQLLLEHGADVNKGGGWRKHKPLIFAYVHNSVDKIRLLLSYGARITEEEMSELVSLSLQKSILENPEVIGPHSKELLSWRLLLKTGSRPLVQGPLATKVHQLSMCSSYGQISPWIRTLLNPLLSLRDLCRITLRSRLPPSVDRNVERLPLPRSLKDFCMFKEFVVVDRDKC